MSHAIASIQALSQAGLSLTPSTKTGHTSFAQSLNQALDKVSEAQHTSSEDNKAVVSGAPGASLEKAMEASAHARVDWNATVAVRNHIVNAYSTIMNMPV